MLHIDHLMKHLCPAGSGQMQNDFNQIGRPDIVNLKINRHLSPFEVQRGIPVKKTTQRWCNIADEWSNRIL